MSLDPEKLSWDKYYKETPVISFQENSFQYYYLSLALREFDPKFWNPKRPMNFLLGGFHPHNLTPSAFEECSRKIHNNAFDRHIYMDMNRYPLEVIGKEHKIQGSLTQSPFSGTIDVMFLDYTVDLMSDQDLSLFSLSSAEALRPQGVSFIAIRDKDKTKQQAKQFPYFPSYARTPEEVTSQIPHLRFLGSMKSSEGQVLAFGKGWGSNFQPLEIPEIE